ncbi:MAG: hypothetical protein KJO22_06940 [Bacteroidia bacterium]|nr:hypothetical protein [Bacteroidia bacterium]
MIKFLILSVKQVAEIGANDPNIFQQIIRLLEVIIWPIAMIIALYMFKNQISKLFNSLGSIKAGAQGFEMNFIEDKLNEATQLIGTGPPDIRAKSGGGINPKSGGGINPKSGGGINPKNDDGIVNTKGYAETPYQELLELQDIINQKLKAIANQNNIDVGSASNFAITSQLEHHQVISKTTSRELKALIELNNLGLNSPKITYAQVTRIKKLFNNISL